MTENCDEPLLYSLKVTTINGFIKTACNHLNGECTLMTASGSIDNVNDALKGIMVQPSCDAPGAKVTYVYDISASVLRDTD